MAEYEILFKESVEKELKKIPAKDLNQILVRIQKLGLDPRPYGSEKLTDQDLYRIRYGHYRIVYFVHETQLLVVIIRVAHRKDVYRH